MQLPRFLLDRSYSLGDALRALGLVQVFGDDADFSNAGGPAGAKLSQVTKDAPSRRRPDLEP